MNLQILSEAEADYATIIQYYQNVGNYEGNFSLALKFENELASAFEFIKNYPLATQRIYKNKLRVYHLNKFPFSVVYEIKNEFILILSIYDQRRKPNF